MARAPMRARRARTAARRSRARRPRPRRANPSGLQLMISERVLAIEYCHIASAGRDPYRHDFTHRGVEMWLNEDGSILLRHPKYRLWEQRIVGDEA